MYDIHSRLRTILGASSPEIPEWPIYRAEGYPEIFMYDEFGRLRWFPNPETLMAYGYSGVEPNIVPISWFYAKPMVESIIDTKTGKTHPAEETPNYQAYRSPAWGLALVAEEVSWWKKYLPWMGVGITGALVVAIILILKKK